MGQAAEELLAALTKLRAEAATQTLAEQLAAFKHKAEPNLLSKAVSYVSAKARHAAAGRPLRKPEEQAAIKLICHACPHTRNDDAKCAICGCTDMDDKRSMATEQCPDSPPRWKAVSGTST